MAFKKHLWEKKFTTLPTWPCPSCGDGTLAPRKGGEFLEETPRSKSCHDEFAWEVEWTDERFSTVLECAACGEVSILSGKCSLVEHQFYNDDNQPDAWAERFYEPHALTPMPCLIDLPANSRPSVDDEIKRASALIWVDHGAAAMRLRTAVEAALTVMKVPATTLNKNRKRVRLSLDARIAKLPAKYAEAKKLLHSLRWLGNVGTHGGIEDIDRADVLDAFEITEHVLSALFDPKEKRLAKVAKEIVKRRGVKKKAKRRKSDLLF